jgi:hypothetical protein
MNLKKLVLPALFILLALALGGCGTSRSASMAPQRTNLLGIVSVERENYQHVGTNTFRVSSSELTASRNYSGDKATFLWGLVTMTNY